MPFTPARFVCVLSSLLVLLVPAAVAQTIGDCNPGVAEAILEGVGVRATLFNNGNFFFGGQGVSSAYEVPTGSGHTPVYAANIWIGGQVGGEIRAAATQYGSFELWPGPLGEDGGPPVDCSAYDRIYVVSRSDIAQYYETGIATDDLRDWPVDLGAPVIDGDGVEGNYSLEDGDQPAISGDQTAWWLMNDRGNVHGRTGSTPLGVEVRTEAWTVQMAGPLGMATFYRYHTLNRSDAAIDSMYMSFWSDVDLGDGNDDYVGSDSSRMVFTYNAENTDAEYGEAPPAIGIALLSEASSAMAFDVFLEGEEPGTLEGYYHAMQGRWRDGTPMTAMGVGYGSEGGVTTWAYHGAPEDHAFWSEINTDGSGSTNNPGERRQLVTASTFSLAPGESHAVVFAILYAHGDDHLDSVARLRGVADIAQNAFDAGIFDPQPVSNTPEPEPFREVALSRPFPNPFREAATLTLTVPERAGALRLAVYDVLGREVAVLADGVLLPGEHALTLDGAGLPSGFYLVRLETGRQTETVKMLLIR